MAKRSAALPGARRADVGAPEKVRAALGGVVQEVRGFGHRMFARRGDEALQHIGGMDAVHQVGIVVRGRAVHAQPDPHAQGVHGGNVGDLGPDQIDRLGAMGDAGLAGGELGEFLVGQLPAMGIQGVGAAKPMSSR